jgi:hypothetical protein
MTSISNRRRLARRALALLATSGACIGLGCLLGARPVGRVAGLPEQGSVRWLLRLFGVRELLLSLGLYRSLRHAGSAADSGLHLADPARLPGAMKRRDRWRDPLPDPVSLPARCSYHRLATLSTAASSADCPHRRILGGRSVHRGG